MAAQTAKKKGEAFVRTRPQKQITLAPDVREFGEVRWRTYKMLDGSLASGFSAYVEDLIVRDREAQRRKR